MTVEGDTSRIQAAAEALVVNRRGERWCHLSLCVLDAVFSINADYATTTRTVKTYAAQVGLKPMLAPASEVASGSSRWTEQPLTEFLAAEGSLAPAIFAARLNNRQLTSTRGGIRKADASQRFARILTDHGIETLGDVTVLLGDLKRTKTVERALAKVPGHGSGVRVSYLWMLAGDDNHIKADRMVLRWLSRILDRTITVEEAVRIVKSAAAGMDATPWELDHAIWLAERARLKRFFQR